MPAGAITDSDPSDTLSVVPDTLQQLVSLATLQPLPQWLRALLFAVVGLAALGGGLYGLNRSLLTAVHPDAPRSATSG